jgi:allophanate hydrolase
VTTSSLPDLTLSRLRDDYAAGTRRPTELVAAIVAAADALADNPVWIHRVDAAALHARARALEAQSPDELPLYGVPFAVKDNIDVAGLPTTAACPDFSYVATDTAPVVQRLLDAGAILVGKTNLDQFATGLVGARSPWGACRNSFDPAYVSGGSSAGSAVAVAAGLVSFSLGTDTAGSGRVPAGFNNIVGLKPTLGNLSTRGVVPACLTLDCVSIFALTAADAASVCAVAAGYDAAHPWSRPLPAAREVPATGFVFGVPRRDQRAFFGNSAYDALYEEAVARLETLGGHAREIDFAPFAETAALLYGGPWVAERYHAARSIIEGNPAALLPVIREIIGGAANYDAVDTFDALYRLAELRRATEPVWREIDAMALPTAPTIPTLAAVAAAPIARNSELGTYTNFVNLLDLAAVAVPAAIAPAGGPVAGLPFGITLIGPAGSDAGLLRLAGRFHAATGLPLGATGRPQPAVADESGAPGAAGRDAAGTAEIEIAVCGAHLSGQPLNHQLTELGGRLVGAALTAPDYRLYALNGGPPARPGLVRSAAGAAIHVEVWSLPAAALGGFVDGIPAPLGVGRIELADGRTVMGFLCEAYATADAVDITEFGDWRRWLDAAAA